MTAEQIEKIKDYEMKMNHGYAVRGSEVTALYNAVLNKNVASTNCGSCLRRRVQEMVAAMHKYLDELAKQEEQKVEEFTVEITPEPQPEPKEEPKPKKVKKSKK